MKEGDDPDLSIFMSLLPGPVAGKDAPPTCPLSTSHRPVQTANELFSRFGNNNFSIHSHLTTLAHGIFPLASRLFNHSCVPNAVAKYKIALAKEVVMEIVTIDDIAPGEEVRSMYYFSDIHAQTGLLDMYSLCRPRTCRSTSADVPVPIRLHVHLSILCSFQATRYISACSRQGRTRISWDFPSRICVPRSIP